MKAKVQEAAGKIIREALAAGMLHVPPARFDIAPGMECTRCGERELHKPGCEPPFGLRAVKP